MTDSFDFSSVDRFVCDAVGPPGQRVFFLEAASGTTEVTLKLEKQQAALLVDYLARLLAAYDLPAGTPSGMHLFRTPVTPEWVIGSLTVAVNEASGQIVVIAREIQEEADDWSDDPDEEPWDDPQEDPWDDLDEGRELRVALSRNQVEEFIERTREVLARGRRACRLCGRPIDPEGHVCPRWN